MAGRRSWTWDSGLTFGLGFDFVDGPVESIEPGGGLDHAQLEVVQALVPELLVRVGLVQGGRQVLGFPDPEKKKANLLLFLLVFTF